MKTFEINTDVLGQTALAGIKWCPIRKEEEEKERKKNDWKEREKKQKEKEKKKEKPLHKKYK